MYTVYRTTNLANGKIYVGIHQTDDPNDLYLGSGVLFTRALRKYGRESFRKEVLFVFDKIGDAAQKESEIVNREFVEREDTYNLSLGGNHSIAWYQARMSRTPEDLRRCCLIANEAQRELERTSPEFRERQRRNGERLVRQNLEAGGLKQTWWNGRFHSDETLKRIREAKKGVGKGEENSCFGTVWVHKDGASKKIPSESLSSFLTKGWSKGRASIMMWVKKEGEKSKMIRQSEFPRHEKMGWTRGKK